MVAMHSSCAVQYSSCSWVHARSSHLEDFEGVEALWTVLHKVDA